jgi:hypothetical protein
LSRKLLRHRKFTEFYIRIAVRTKNAIPEFSLDTRDFCFVKLSTHAMTHARKCFAQTISSCEEDVHADKLSQAATLLISIRMVIGSSLGAGSNISTVALRLLGGDEK